MGLVRRNLASNLLSVTLLFSLSLGILFSNSVYAHEVRPAIVDFKSDSSGQFTLEMVFNLESWLANIGSEHSDTDESPNKAQYEMLRKLPADELEAKLKSRLPEFIRNINLRFDDNATDIFFENIAIPGVGDVDLLRDSKILFSGNIPAGAQAVSWELKSGASVFRVEGNPGDDGDQIKEKVSSYVKAAQTSNRVKIVSPVQKTTFGSFVEYIQVGFDHIVPKGLDHILFVVGLFLLSTRLSPLLWQITSFTIAHTVTLGLGMAGVISIPGNIVEPLIAASIVYVAIENIFMDRLSPWRPVIVFFFGLLHGLGFAGVLKEFGLGTGNFVAGLIGFNVGVELGQLTVIAGCFLLVGIWFGNKDWYHQRITIPGSIAIALVGGWWFYERVFLA